MRSSQYRRIAPVCALRCIPINGFLEVPQERHAIYMRLAKPKPAAKRMEYAHLFFAVHFLED
jgi:hypothetical protein